MALARLLGHVQRLRVHPVRRSTTVFDDEAGEPFAGGLDYEATPILVRVQLEYSSARGRTPSQGGAVIPVVARATCLYRDAVRLGWTPTDGDRVVAVLEPGDADDAPGAPVELYVGQVWRKGKTHHGGELLVCGLRDRQPVRNASEGSQ